MNETAIVAMVGVFSAVSAMFGFVIGVFMTSVLQNRKLDEILNRIRSVENEVEQGRTNTGPVPGEMDV